MDFRNPLGFFCPPNGTDAHYSIEHDFKRFLAFGFLMSWENLLGQGCEQFNSTEIDVYWLRKNFLAEVQIALDALPDMLDRPSTRLPARAEPAPVSPGLAFIDYEGDHDEGGASVTYQGAEEPTYFRWSFDACYVIDQSLLFTLNWDMPDDAFLIWLHIDAVWNAHRRHPGLRGEVESVMRAAEAANEQCKEFEGG